MRHIVWLESEPFGWEKFEYPTRAEALAGLERLAGSAFEHKKVDGIDRHVSYEMLPDDDNSDDDDDWHELEWEVE